MNRVISPVSLTQVLELDGVHSLFAFPKFYKITVASFVLLLNG